MSFLLWLLGTVIIDPLIMLFIWNVLAVPMFGAVATNFWVCFWISVILNCIIGVFKLNSSEEDNSYSYWDKRR